MGRHWGLGDRAHGVLAAAGTMVGAASLPLLCWLGKWATERSQPRPLLGIVVSGRELSGPIREASGSGEAIPQPEQAGAGGRLDCLLGCLGRTSLLTAPVGSAEPLLQPPKSLGGTCGEGWLEG